jgi:translocation and assembly module TamA
MVMVKHAKDFFLYLLLFLLFLTPLFSKKADSIMSPIIFHGNEVLSNSELEEMIGVEKPPLYVFWKDNRAKVDAKLRSKLNETFKLFYRSEGFYETNISHKITSKGIEVFINENRPVVIKEVEIKSDVDLSEEINLVKGTRFRAKAFSEMKNNIHQKLLTLGYCSPQLSTKAYISLEAYAANVVVDLKKRKPCHFGEITIENNSSTMDNDIILSRLQFEEGNLFDISKIQESYDALYALESFDQLTLDYSKKFYNKKPIKITYKEVDKKIHTRMGIGYATDLKFQAKLYAEYKNFRGNAKKIVFDGLVSDIQKIAETRFFVPYVFSLNGYHFDFQNSLGYAEEQGIHEYDERLLYNRFYLSRNSSLWFMSAGFGVEQIETLNSNISNHIDLLIYPFIRIIFDKRDSKLNPKNGFYFSHEMEYGLPYSASSTSYLKYIDELRLIYTPFYDITWSAVGRIGSIKLYENNLPESKKFFAGGAFSNRGYGYERIGITESSTSDLTLGGFTLTNLSLETNFPIYKNFRGAFFSDQTMISDNQGIWEFHNKVIHSAGFGVRYLTPMGPFKLDFGVNVNNTKERGIHFQVGQSF